GQIDFYVLAFALLHLAEDSPRKPSIFLFLCRYLYVQLSAKRFSFMRQDFHLSHVRRKERQVIVYKDMKLFERIVNPGNPLFKTFQNAAKAMILNEKQQFFFRFTVMIETRETDARCAGNIAHRGRVITFVGKDLRRSAQDVFEFLIVAADIVHHGFTEMSRR